MPDLRPNPIPNGLADYARRLRAGEITALEATKGYLDRIEAVNPKLEAFIHVAAEEALETAQGIDRLLAGGTDLGPLMGVPVAVKDLLTVAGMPATAGSRLDVADLIPEEGVFVQALKRAGCVILGKTRTIEFALGAQNVSLPTPWNPWDEEVRRSPGGSSNGSAVALAAGLCGLAIGTDTGGSVRLPAALCGLFGLKTTFGLWPLDGVFPLSPLLDTIGLLTSSAGDGMLGFAALQGTEPIRPEKISGKRFGKPVNYFLEDLDGEVKTAFDDACERLIAAGAVIEEMVIPETDEIQEKFALMVPGELIATLGRSRFLTGRDIIDPVTEARASAGLSYQATEYINDARRLAELNKTGQQRLEGYDGLLTPTCALVSPSVDSLGEPEEAAAFSAHSLRNTRVVNILGLCAATVPIPVPGLPVGLQVIARPFAEERLLGLCLGLEELLGKPAQAGLFA